MAITEVVIIPSEPTSPSTSAEKSNSSRTPSLDDLKQQELTGRSKNDFHSSPSSKPKVYEQNSINDAQTTLLTSTDSLEVTECSSLQGEGRTEKLKVTPEDVPVFSISNEFNKQSVKEIVLTKSSPEATPHSVSLSVQEESCQNEKKLLPKSQDSTQQTRSLSPLIPSLDVEQVKLINPFTGHLESACSDEEEDNISHVKVFKDSESNAETATSSDRCSSESINKDTSHSSDTDSGIGKFVNDASSLSSSEVSNPERTPPSEIVPCINNISGNSHDQAPIEVEISNLEMVDLTIRCEGDSVFDVEELSLPKVMSEVSYPLQNVVVDPETVGEKRSYSVTDGDHNYFTQIAPKNVSGQDVHSSQVGDIKERSKEVPKSSDDTSAVKNHVRRNQSHSYHASILRHNLIEVSESITSSSLPSSSTATTLIENDLQTNASKTDLCKTGINNILVNYEDSPRLVLFPDMNHSDVVSSSHLQSCPLTPRSRNSSTEIVCTSSQPIMNKNAKTSRLKRRKLSGDNPPPALDDSSISLCSDRQMTVSEITVNSWKKTRLRGSKTEMIINEAEELEKPSPRTRRINHKEANKSEAAPAIRVSGRKRKGI